MYSMEYPLLWFGGRYAWMVVCSLQRQPFENASAWNFTYHSKRRNSNKTNHNASSPARHCCGTN